MQINIEEKPRDLKNVFRFNVEWLIHFLKIVFYYLQVDIFSYGIWLYELMSGYRPFRKFRSNAEMKKAIIRGVRPSLRQDSINSNLPFLECIMEVRITFLIQKFRLLNQNILLLNQ